MPWPSGPLHVAGYQIKITHCKSRLKWKQVLQQLPQTIAIVWSRHQLQADAHQHIRFLSLFFVFKFPVMNVLTTSGRPSPQSGCPNQSDHATIEVPDGLNHWPVGEQVRRRFVRSLRRWGYWSNVCMSVLVRKPVCMQQVETLACFSGSAESEGGHPGAVWCLNQNSATCPGICLSTRYRI